ncbi:MAG: antitoxin [Opitutales bacterium]
MSDANPGKSGRRVAVFKNGANRAIRIPREYDFEEEAVWITREGKRLVLEPIPKSSALLAALESMKPLKMGFPSVDDDLSPLDEPRL